MFEAACAVGCHIAGAGAEKLTAAREYGMQLGMSFQIVDDILDATATSEQLGKPAGSDIEHGKATYVSLLGVKAAAELAKERVQKAVKALSVFGNKADALCDLAFALLKRKK